MRISKSTYFVLVFVIAVMTLSVTVFKGGKGSATSQKGHSITTEVYQDRKDRYPVAESEETEPTDPIKRAKLSRQKKHFDKDAPFSNPGPKDAELAFLPEAQFDFPALPIAKSDVIVIGQVVDAQAHRSENRMNVFSVFEVRIDEVLKGSNLTAGNLVDIERIGGFVKYPNGRKVLFRLAKNGMPAVGERYVFFLNIINGDYSILTGYELGPEGVLPLDNSRQFLAYQGETETNFIKSLRDAISQAIPQ